MGGCAARRGEWDATFPRTQVSSIQATDPGHCILRPSISRPLLEVNRVTIRIEGRFMNPLRHGGMGMDGGVEVVDGRLEREPKIGRAPV